ncbi:MAG: hypothetical protein QGF33_06270, partial [Alphaproteobacteria bacterium]|nr:hypothetical protein [Alphaproteobacteria bacterium]
MTDPIKFTGDFEAFRPSPDRAPPTVLQILPALVSGGVERGTIEIVQALTSAGWRARVVSSGGPMVREVERAGGEHLSLPVHAKAPWRWRSNIDALTRIVIKCAVASGCGREAGFRPCAGGSMLLCQTRRILR